MTVIQRERYRLITRSDFDGLVCAMLLKELHLIDDILFVHPKDMQDGKVEVTDRDITTNLPYVPGAYLVFDHHESETQRLGGRQPNHVIDPKAPSAARFVYDHFGGPAVFRGISSELMGAVDVADSAQYTLQEVLKPQRWVLLNFLMDARTGLGRFREFRISNYRLMMQLIDTCKNLTIEEILALPDVAERVELYFEQEALFKEQLRRCTTVHGNAVVVDLRREPVIHAGNRFMVYALFPQANVSVHVLWGRQQQNVAIPVGKSIFNRTSRTNVGELMLAYGGGGHPAAGTCQVEIDDADRVVGEIVARLNADG
jgi:nanoRNase/pAp phosphatase (c-di-AMP/oligoRNAs hydrolase)